jgi:hypothetical protein
MGRGVERAHTAYTRQQGALWELGTAILPLPQKAFDFGFDFQKGAKPVARKASFLVVLTFAQNPLIHRHNNKAAGPLFRIRTSGTAKGKHNKILNNKGRCSRQKINDLGSLLSPDYAWKTRQISPIYAQNCRPEHQSYPPIMRSVNDCSQGTCGYSGSR